MPQPSTDSEVIWPAAMAGGNNGFVGPDNNDSQRLVDMGAVVASMTSNEPLLS